MKTKPYPTLKGAELERPPSDGDFINFHNASTGEDTPDARTIERFLSLYASAMREAGHLYQPIAAVVEGPIISINPISVVKVCLDEAAGSQFTRTTYCYWVDDNRPEQQGP